MRNKVFIAAIFAIFFFLINSFLIKNESLTFDEPVHIKAGNLFNQRQFWFDPMETPLIRSTVVAIANHLNVDHRHVILFLNASLFAILGLLFSSSIQIFLYFFVLTDPGLISFSHLFITDVLSSLFAFLFYLSIRKNNPNIIYPSILFALASASKVATLAFIVPAIIIFWRHLGWRKILAIFALTFLFIWWTYGFSSLIVLERYPISVPFGGYLRTIKENILFSLRGQPIYFLDKTYLHSPWYKTILIILIKITLPVLTASLLLIKQAGRYKKDLILWAIYLIIQSSKSLNFGSRHLLLFNLIFILLAAFSLSKIKSNILAVSLVSLQLILFINTYPYTPSFANPYLPNPEKYLSDSDYDWGGGLLYLSSFIKESKISDFQLAYSGNIDPLLTLGKYHRISDNNPVASLPVQDTRQNLPTFISVTCFHACGYQDHPFFASRPYTLVAGSFMYFQ